MSKKDLTFTRVTLREAIFFTFSTITRYDKKDGPQAHPTSSQIFSTGSATL